ncbi:MAG: hypothetical protein IJ570_05125 [Prevotella sp.]|nr:hypothetical protein [Prevotella sp.]
MNHLKTLLLLFVVLTSTAKATNNVIRVKAGDASSLLNAIEQANIQNADSAKADWLFILIPDGIYDLGDRVLTTLTGHRVALIGQSMTGTIIQNKPATEDEGISKTATLRLMTSDTYLQDLTLKNALEYYKSGAAGRAVCLHDKGTRTICRRVRMLSYQDTYYSDCLTGQMYFENSEIHGTVDFICGPADVYFNRCTIVTERRKPDGSGRTVIAAPRTDGTPWGYIFESCVIYNRLSGFNWARGWKATPHCIWLNTTLMSPEKLIEPRFDPQGMRTVQSDFKEFNTMDASGRNITPKSNVVTFTLNDERNSVETILTAEEAKKYDLKKIFPRWRPEKIADKLARKAARLKQ